MAPRPYKLGKRQAAVEETRRRIVDAIVALHAEKGVAGTSVEDIARRADVALGTVQRHFPSLDDIVGACGPRILEITKPPHPEVFAGVDSLSQRVKILLEELFAFYERSAPWLEVGHCERKKVPVLDARLRHLEDRLQAMVVEAFKPIAIDKHAIKTITALTDFHVWKSLSRRGLAEEGSALMTKVLLGWLGEYAPRQESVAGDKPAPKLPS